MLLLTTIPALFLLLNLPKTKPARKDCPAKTIAQNRVISYEKINSRASATRNAHFSKTVAQILRNTAPQT